MNPPYPIFAHPAVRETPPPAWMYGPMRYGQALARLAQNASAPINAVESRLRVFHELIGDRAEFDVTTTEELLGVSDVVVVQNGVRVGVLYGDLHDDAIAVEDDPEIGVEEMTADDWEALGELIGEATSATSALHEVGMPEDESPEHANPTISLSALSFSGNPMRQASRPRQ